MCVCVHVCVMHIDLFSGMNRSPCTSLRAAWRRCLQSHFYMSPSIDLYAHNPHKSMINVMRSGSDGATVMACTPGSHEVMTVIYHIVIYGIIISTNGGD